MKKIISTLTLAFVITMIFVFTAQAADKTIKITKRIDEKTIEQYKTYDLTLYDEHYHWGVYDAETKTKKTTNEDICNDANIVFSVKDDVLTIKKTTKPGTYILKYFYYNDDEDVDNPRTGNYSVKIVVKASTQIKPVNMNKVVVLPYGDGRLTFRRIYVDLNTRAVYVLVKFRNTITTGDVTNLNDVLKDTRKSIKVSLTVTNPETGKKTTKTLAKTGINYNTNKGFRADSKEYNNADWNNPQKTTKNGREGFYYYYVGNIPEGTNAGTLALIYK